MKRFLLALLAGSLALASHAQNRLVTLGSSTTAGLSATPIDSSWVNRVSRYYKTTLGVVDSVYNLGVSATTQYNAMPSSYSPPASRPAPDTSKNITKANRLLTGFTTNGVVIVNFPTNGYDGYTIAEIMTSLQVIYDSATAAGHRCFVTTTQPRSDALFASSAAKAKLAAIKDSIINRFGVAHTLNFWDGMYNPTDTTILAAYSAGDNVHFNNAGHRELFNRVVAKNIFNLSAPVTGDYRSNIATGLWNTAATWLVYNGTAWVTAGAPPDNTSGTITIRSGDSIRVNNATTMDQVIVENGGILAIFNTGTPTVFSLSDGAGDDIVVHGKLYTSSGATLTGAGNVYVAPDGIFILRNQGIHSVTTLNEGTMRVSGTGNLSGTTLTNNGTLLLIDFTMNLNNNAVLINNDSVSVQYASDAYFATTSGTGTFVNAAGSVLHKAAATGIAYINNNVAFSNAGTIKGTGQFVFNNITANTGSLSPGNSPGILTVNPAAITGKTPVLKIEIAATGAVAGTHYDQLQLSTVNTTTTNISGATLQLTATGSDPIGTLYPVIISAGTITGTFASVSLPANFGNLTYNAGSITVQKLAATPLPILLQRFAAQKSGTDALLSWEAEMPDGSGSFTIERATDGKQFTAIGTVTAHPQQRQYRFTDAGAAQFPACYYRLRITETEEGRESYSGVQAVYFNGSWEIAAFPNPVQDLLQLQLPQGEAQVTLTDISGRIQQQWTLTGGSQYLSMAGLAPGIYLLIAETTGLPPARLRIVKQ
jgi:lysophospholipase L1-like esterase